MVGEGALDERISAAEFSSRAMAEEAGAEETFSDQPSPSSSLSPPPGWSFFDLERHVTFLEMMYQMLPHHYQSQEINHVTLAYFVISGLDILNALDRVKFHFSLSCVLDLKRLHLGVKILALISTHRYISVV